MWAVLRPHHGTLDSGKQQYRFGLKVPGVSQIRLTVASRPCAAAWRSPPGFESYDYGSYPTRASERDNDDLRPRRCALDTRPVNRATRGTNYQEQIGGLHPLSDPCPSPPKVHVWRNPPHRGRKGNGVRGMKKEVRQLREKAINSLVLSIDHFNRPWDRGRTEAVLILLDHSFEMILKSAIRHRLERYGKPKRSKPLDSMPACARLSRTET